MNLVSSMGFARAPSPNTAPLIRPPTYTRVGDPILVASSLLITASTDGADARQGGDAPLDVSALVVLLPEHDRTVMTSFDDQAQALIDSGHGSGR